MSIEHLVVKLKELDDNIEILHYAPKDENGVRWLDTTSDKYKTKATRKLKKLIAGLMIAIADTLVVSDSKDQIFDGQPDYGIMQHLRDVSEYSVTRGDSSSFLQWSVIINFKNFRMIYKEQDVNHSFHASVLVT